MKRTWILIAVAAAGALGGFAVTGPPGEVNDDLVITERPAPPTTLGEIVVPTTTATTSAGSQGTTATTAATDSTSDNTAGQTTSPATTAP